MGPIALALRYEDKGDYMRVEYYTLACTFYDTPRPSNVIYDA